MVTQRPPARSRANPATNGARLQPPSRPTWGFLTNHPVLLIYVAQHPESTVRAIAAGVGITERATLAILRDLDDEHLIERHRTGRRNTYALRYTRLLGMAGGTEAAPNPAVVAVVRAMISISPEGVVASRRRHTPSEEDRAPRVGTWEFFTNHMMMLAAIARERTATVRELATSVGITERATVAILHQLEADGIIQRHREGRRNSYTIDLEAFRAFRGWQFESWRVPQALIDVAVNGIRFLAGM